MPADFLTLMLDGRVPMKFRLIPPGEFRMGSRGFDASEEPIHRVRISMPFYIGVYPVTQLQWRTIVEIVLLINDRNNAPQHGGLKTDPSGFKGDNRPVDSVNWYESRAWCQRLSRSNALRDCTDEAGERVAITHVELPTEAQWEYACRLVQTHPHPVCGDTEYCSGDGEAVLSAVGWYRGNSEKQTHDVGRKLPSGIGLYDMYGNVDEWCLDARFDDVYKQRIDGVADPMVTSADLGKSENDALRVIRGGSMSLSAGICRAASRGRAPPVNRLPNLGFRVCLFFGPTPPSQPTGTVDVTEVDLSNASLPKLSAGTKF